MVKEINSLHKNKTWDLVPLLKGKRDKWIYTKKEGPMRKNGISFKARLVGKGYE